MSNTISAFSTTQLVDVSMDESTGVISVSNQRSGFLNGVIGHMKSIVDGGKTHVTGLGRTTAEVMVAFGGAQAERTLELKAPGVAVVSGLKSLFGDS